MREILDTLDLPEGFGFIVRTAGFNASKAELKRDVAYLKRLWQQIDKRISNTGAPCLLYAESDLLIRTIRDVVDASVTKILIDEPQAFERATGFLKVAAPRSAPSVRFYDQSMPVFSTYDIERQIDQIHEETVPLKSGGALVIQQTEALVAIDVNSGRSRSARDSETNAYETNVEAVDEICRQLRLRDLGGVIINDLIDMRQQKHRQNIEDRLVQNLGRDRAKTTVLPISEFGIVEMTRQRMRPNTQRANYQTCDSCEGRGVQLRVDAVAADAIRKAATILDNKSTSKVELVCSSDVAAKLMDDRRKTIDALEERFEKKIVIRVSDTMPNNRVDLYAYDSQGADIEPRSINRQKLPNFEDFPEALDDDMIEAGANSKKTGKRRRRRRGKTAPADATAIALAGGFEIDDDELEEDEKPESRSTDAPEGEGTSRKRSRRRGGRNRRRKGTEQPAPETLEPMRIYALAKELGITSREILDRCVDVEEIEVKNHMSSVGGEAIIMIRGWFTPEAEPTKEAEPTDADADGKSPEGEHGEGEGEVKRKRRRRRRGRRGRGRREDGENQESGDENGSTREEPSGEHADEVNPVDNADNADNAEQADADVPNEGEPRKRRRRRGGRRRRNKGNGDPDAQDNENRDGNSEQADEVPENDRKHAESREDGDGAQGDKPKRRRSRNRSKKPTDVNSEASPKSSSDRAPSDRASSDRAPSDRAPSDRAPSNPPASKNADSKTSNDKKDAPRKPRTLYGGRIRRLGVVGDPSKAGR
jgi:ribonuclease E